MSPTYPFDPKQPYFGYATITNPEDKGKECCTSVATFSYACSGCNELKAELRKTKNQLAIDSIEWGRTGDHLRSQIATLRKELLAAKNTQSLQDKFGHTYGEYREAISQRDAVIRKLNDQIVQLEKDLADIKERNLDPEPHKLKAAILTMQKQIDDLTDALEQEREKDTCDCYDEYECDCETLDEVREKCVRWERLIEDQNRTIGAKQEEINTLKIALNKSLAKQTFELKPAGKIIAEYEDKIRRLINVANSKDQIISGLQESIRTIRSS